MSKVRFRLGKANLHIACKDNNSEWTISPNAPNMVLTSEGGVVHGTVVGFYNDDVVVKLENQSDEGISFVVAPTEMLRQEIDSTVRVQSCALIFVCAWCFALRCTTNFLKCVTYDVWNSFCNLLGRENGRTFVRRYRFA